MAGAVAGAAVPERSGGTQEFAELGSVSRRGSRRPAAASARVAADRMTWSANASTSAVTRGHRAKGTTF